MSEVNPSAPFLAGILEWLQNFERSVCLNTNDNEGDTYHATQLLIAAGTESEINIYPAQPGGLEKLQKFFQHHRGEWIFGHLNYEANQFFEAVSPADTGDSTFPLISFFVPETVLEWKGEGLILHKGHMPTLSGTSFQKSRAPRQLKPGEWSKHILLPKAAYLQRLEALLNHIRHGDIYEVNFCHPAIFKDVRIDPYRLFLTLSHYSNAPFGAFYRYGNAYLCGASPERFLARRGNKLITQPIKGTNRSDQNPEINEKRREELLHSPKERSENVMIVDLMRNDLARICLPGSVNVEELFGIYSFRHVNHMISTITGNCATDLTFMEAMHALFPMGSMTGAPKVKAMELISNYEPACRGIYSGTIGYIRPDGDWDFNVVIRSIRYDSSKGMVTIHAGGAITSLSDPETEYAESLLKMESLIKIIYSEIEKI